SGLFPSINNLPRCYTFVPYADRAGREPVFLAVGHNWGVSLYECRPGEVKLVRIMVGHEGEVMSVAPAPDGKTLVTASRDQTLARLRDVRPSEELLFFKKVRGREVVKLTTSRQRPLWRFFVERQAEGRGRDWILWRCRDYFYDTNSARADRYVGWQVNAGAGR